MAGASDLEQLLLEYINETRMNPLASAGRYITGYDTLRSSDREIQSALDYFQVDGPALKAAFAALVPVQPVAWNDSLAAAARTHDRVMIDTQSQTHQAPNEPGLMERALAAGYGDIRSLGENVYAYSQSMLYAHAGFMVDWGPGANGMQNPAGHRIGIMNANYAEVGIGVVAETDAATPVGPYVVTEDFGARIGANRFALGVAYTDRDHDNFYSLGEGRSDLVVSLGGATVTSGTSGGWQVEALSGSRLSAALNGGWQVMTLSGGGLAGAVAVTLRSSTGNMKVDIVDGDTLKLYGTAIVSGPVAKIDLLGLAGNVTLEGETSTRVTGGSGSDEIRAAFGDDNLFGGAGNDTLYGNAGNDHLFGQSASGGADGADLLDGGAGSDYIQGNAGNDTIFGGPGSDRMNGGADDDHIVGSEGNDTANGNRGNDRIFGDGGNDLLRGGQGNDTLDGGTDDDTLYGDLGDDSLIGSTGTDLLYGGAGNDTLDGGGGGPDLLVGGDGADLFTFGTTGAGILDLPDGSLRTVTIADFADGIDRLHIDWGNGRHVLVAGAEAQADTLAAAAYAHRLMTATPGDFELVTVRVGTDTMLFYDASRFVGIGGALTAIPTQGIRLAGVDQAQVTMADFI